MNKAEREKPLKKLSKKTNPSNITIPKRNTKIPGTLKRNSKKYSKISNKNK